MAWTYPVMEQALIPNTVMQMGLKDGVHKIYRITPVDGYVLHDNAGNWTEIDPITEEEITKEAYYTGTCSCAANYDFTANPREFYAVPADSVPADQIFGGVNNDHEVM